MLNTVVLEQLATELREILELDSETILNPNHLEELSKKIEANLEGFKIESSEDAPWLLLENEKNFTIYIYGNEETRFYDLVQQLAFAITLDKKSLNYYQLQRSVYPFPRMSSEDNGASNYLMLAFMMPRKAFLSALTQYSSGDGSNVQMFEMQEKVNKYCYRRGKDLHIW